MIYYMVGVRVGCRDSVVGIATGWSVRGSNPGRGRDFPCPTRPAPRSTQPPVQWVPGYSVG